MADNALDSSRSGGGNIYSILANPTVVNPLQAYSSAASAAKNIYDVRSQQANQAIGAILQQATDENGNVDYGTAQSLAANAGPTVQAGMQDFLKNAASLKGAQMNQGIARNTAVNNAIVGALNGDDAGLHDRAVGGFKSLVANGAMTPDEAVKSALTLPNDPTQLRQRLQQIQTSLAPPDLQQQQISGRPVTTTAPGGALVGGTQDIRTGAVSAPTQPGIQQGMSPAETAEYQRWLNSPRDYPDPTNPTVTKHGTNATYLTDTGVPSKYIYPGGAAATPGTSPPSPLGTGRNQPPPALQNQNKPQASAGAPAATPAPSPAGTGISGPTPAQAAAAAATVEGGKLGPPQFQAEAARSSDAQNQQAILGNMLADTSQFTTGPLAGVVGKVRNFAGNLGLNINTDAQSAKESFTKLAAGLATAQASSVGAATDTRFNVVSAANPHEELSPAGVDLILRQLQGNADYIRARATLAAKYPNKADYPGFQESIKGLDPRVFQMARMTQPQRDTYWKSLDTSARQQIDAAGKTAAQLGVLGGG